MTVLLVGGTGLLGGTIAELLTKRSEPVRALVRSGKRAAALRELGIELEVGDLRDRRSLLRTLEDVRAVISTAQGDPFRRSRPIAAIDGQGNLNLIAAAREAGVQHMVFISALGAAADARAPQLAYKQAAEQALQASGMSYTILRPAAFQETFGNGFTPFKRLIEQSGIGLTIGRGAGPQGFVALRDVARAAVLSLDLPTARNTLVPLCGPELLSYREAYARIARLTKRPIRVIGLPRALLYVSGLLAAPLLPDLRGFFQLLLALERAGADCTTPTWMVDALGRRRTFDDAVREMYRVEP